MELKELVDSISQAIIDKIVNHGLRVSHGDEVERFRDKEVTVAEVSELLGVRYVLIGEVGGNGEDVRIDATLHDVVLGMSIFRGSFYGDRMTISVLHEDVTSSLLVVIDSILG